ncbi:type II toxin-antitoxin system HicB family antitoxin [Flavisolibacter nicotianae]|uniref:type II toxin-antitoxin system HicB family antitoxin n=1 Tax=Flavisolibacter nicotianae TaxID=2364882 RepID=UPI000EAD7B89|nr:type II toxin-antitoxin system HicB family antitoxin [Flavisolibacter nicotianae]
MKLTIAIVKGDDYFIGTIKEIPAVLTQGETIEEARENVLDALRLYLEDMQQDKSLENIVLEEDLTIA